MPGSGIDKKIIDEKVKTPKNPANMALPKGVKSPIDYRGLYSSNEMDGNFISEKAVSKKQQQFFGIVRAIQKGEQAPTTPETAKAAADMKKSDVKKFASTKHKKLPDKIEEKLDKKDVPHVKKLVKKLRDGSKTHAKQADDLEKAMKEENLHEIPAFVAGALKFGAGALKSKAGLKFLGGLGMGAGRALPYIVAPKTMLAVQGLGLVKQVARKSAADKENENIKLQKEMGESITDEALTIQNWNVDDIKFTEIETVDIIKAKPIKESMSNWRDELDEDWQSVNRKDKTDGMSKKAVKAYRRENPGSKLKTAVTKDPKKLKKGSKSAKRRLSFCRRMKGMKKRLTSAKTARDPDSRINKALRRWNC